LRASDSGMVDERLGAHMLFFWENNIIFCLQSKKNRPSVWLWRFLLFFVFLFYSLIHYIFKLDFCIHWKITHFLKWFLIAVVERCSSSFRDKWSFCCCLLKKKYSFNWRVCVFYLLFKWGQSLYANLIEFNGLLAKRPHKEKRKWLDHLSFWWSTYILNETFEFCFKVFIL